MSRPTTTSRWLSLAVAALLAPSAAAAADDDLRLRAHLGTLLGTTDYGLDATVTGQVEGRPVQVTGSSLLEWPLDFVLAGADAELRTALAGRPLLLLLRVATNLGDARGALEDSDYLSSPDLGLPETKFSYTRSETTSRAVIAELAAGLCLVGCAGLAAGGGRRRLHLLLGYRHEYVSLDGYGAEGWQLGPGGQRHEARLDDDVHAIHYESHHRLPFVGLHLEDTRPRGPAVDLAARVLYVSESHLDDHVLRNKEGRADTTGAGLGLRLFPHTALGDGDGGLRLGLSGELQYLWTEGGTLRQEYYADDPSMEGDQQGEDIPEANFDTSTMTLQVTLVLELRR